MSTTVKNLELNWQDSVDEPDLNEITDMADGLPFEKQREHRLSLDREAIADGLYSTTHDRRRYLLAHFGDDLVGSIALTELPGDRLIAEWELVQRNRDDIRGQLFRVMADQYPGHRLLIQYPAQNRTARQFIQAHTNLTIHEQNQALHLHGCPRSDDNPILEALNNTNVLSETLSQLPEEQSAFDWEPLEQLWPIERDTITVEQLNGGLNLLIRRLNTRNEDTSRQILALKTRGGTENGEFGEALNRWIQSQSIDHLEWTVPDHEEDALTTNDDLEIINKRVNSEIELNN